MSIKFSIGQITITLTVPPELIQKLLEGLTVPSFSDN